jgi:hypothetical protein
VNKYFLIFVAFFLSACVINDGKPRPSNMSVGNQEKLKSVKHWDVVADDVALTISELAIDSNSPVFISQDDTTSFGKVFPSYLKSRLITKGVKISTKGESALIVDVNVNAVRHVVLDKYRPGSLSALAGGVLVLRDVANTTRSTIGALAGLAIAADAVKSYNEVTKPPSSEVVLTTSIAKDNLFILHRTDAYYIDGADSSLFENSVREIPVVKGLE